MDLNTILIILGVIALLALIAHGLWSRRREKSQYFQNSNNFTGTAQSTQQPVEQEAVTTPDFSTPKMNYAEPEPAPLNESRHSEAQPYSHTEMPSPHTEEQNIEQQISQIRISIPTEPQVASAQSHFRPNYDDMEFKQPSQNVADMSIEQLEANIDQLEGINSSSPELREQLARMANGELDIPIQPEPTPVKTPATSGFMMLYVVSADQREFHGLPLTNALEGLGFIFGERNLYHRHLDLSVASPVLFSVANIQQPGSFDLYNMADFTTMGVVLFMPLPSPGNDIANLRVMIHTAKTLADELGGVVLTDNQEIFDSQAEQAYLAQLA